MAKPKTLDSLLIKPAGPDCNLACGYCFYLETAELWPETRQHRMEIDLLELLVRQAMESTSPRLSFGWQGGEPTLMGLSFFQQAVDFQQRYGQGKTVANGLQTNGLLIDGAWAQFLARYDFLVGLSLDGPQHVHDRYRRQHDGEGTWEKVVDRAHRLLDAGVAVNALIVVNDHSVDYPEEIYAYHKELGLPHMQFIPAVENQALTAEEASYRLPAEKFGEFLVRLFDCWWNDLDGLTPATSIRFFDSLLFTYVGMTPPDCTLQETCGDYLVVEHNGDVYACDFYVTPEWKLGNLRDDRLIDLLDSPLQDRFGEIKADLPVECETCSWLVYCRGGCPKDRICGPSDTGLSRLCSAYRAFFDHADSRMKELASAWKRQQQHAMQAEARRTRHTASSPRQAAPGRNDPCPCGSGKKYKRCCGP